MAVVRQAVQYGVGERIIADSWYGIPVASNLRNLRNLRLTSALEIASLRASDCRERIWRSSQEKPASVALPRTRAFWPQMAQIFWW